MNIFTRSSGPSIEPSTSRSAFHRFKQTKAIVSARLPATQIRPSHFSKRCNACKCTDHPRRTHRLCPFNKVTASQVTDCDKGNAEADASKSSQVPMANLQRSSNKQSTKGRASSRSSDESYYQSIFNLISDSEIEAALPSIDQEESKSPTAMSTEMSQFPTSEDALSVIDRHETEVPTQIM